MIAFVCVTRLPTALFQKDLERSDQILTRYLSVRGPVEIAVRFVSISQMQKLNHRYRHKDCPTDVLSFSQSEYFLSIPRSQGKEPVLWGDLIVCPTFAKKEAERRGIELREELIRLIVHGTLHLAGYDHETLKEEEKMFALQERLVKQIAS